MNPLMTYLPQDRRRALARGETLPDHTTGAALFADISGFTPLTEALTQALGPRRGAEALTHHLNRVYDALVVEVERYGGSVVSFAGDSMICWFDDRNEGREMKEEFASSFIPHLSSLRALTCALALQTAMDQFAAIALSEETTTALALKTAVASGPAHRYVVGDPNLQLLDALAGATIARTATAEHLANPGEVLVDQPTVDALGAALRTAEWRIDPDTQERFAVVQPGSPLPLAPTPQPEPLPPLAAEQLRPWLLPAVYEREQAGHGAFLTELRPAVALFLRFGGWDYDSPDADAQLDAFIRRAQAILVGHGGTLLELVIGDKGSYLGAVFGAPIAHEDDPRRAINAALALRQFAAEVEALAPVQIGLSRGTMRTGAYGSVVRRTYGVHGDEVNLAARLMQSAAPGEILLSSRVQQAVIDTPDLGGVAGLSLQPRPPIRMKGKAEPFPVFALVGAHQRRAIRLQEPTYALPMVGREVEFHLIAEKLELALQGQGQLVGITAEAGMGKSRLLAEVIRMARRRNLTAYGGACQSDGLNTSFLVWRPIFWALFDLDPAASLRRQIRTIEGELEELAPQRVEALPLLGAVLGLPLPDNDFTRSLEPQFRKSTLEALLLDCLREAGKDGTGLLLVLEDLHWLDPASHDLLEQVARAITELPVLIALAYRPPELQRLQAPRLEHLPHFTRIGLSELSASEAEQSIRAKLAQLFPERGGAVPVALIEHVTERAQGNPFYLEELLNFLHDRGLDLHDEAALAALDLPASLHSLILSRIDQLSARQQLTLKVASVIGRVFHFAHLHGYYPALGATGEIKDDLDRLSWLELTPLETPEPELAYLFKHIITRQVAYESLAYATRALLHEQYARFLEAQAGEEVERYLDLLAYHYDYSDNLKKRWEYLGRAGAAAARRYANAEALDYLSRALALTPNGETAAQFDLLLARVMVYDRLGERDSQRQDVETLSQLAETLNGDRPRAGAALQQAIYAHRISDYPGCIATAQQAATMGQTAGALAVVAEAHHYWASALLGQGDYEAARGQAEASLDLARGLSDRAGESHALQTLGVIADYQGDGARARAYCDQSLRLAREIGDRRGEGAAINSLGVIADKQGDYAGARARFEQRLLIAREIGDRRAEVTSLNNLGAAAANQRDDVQARAYCEQGLRLARETGDRQGEGLLLGNLGMIAVRQREFVSARTHYEQALSISRAIGNPEIQAWSLWGLGNVELESGHLAKAAAAYEQALILYRELGDPAPMMEPVAGLARVALARGDSNQAQSLVEEILSHLQHGSLDGAEEPFLVYLTCYQVLQATHDLRADSILTVAYNLLQERAADIDDEASRRMFLENAPHHRELAAAWKARHSSN